MMELAKHGLNKSDESNDSLVAIVWIGFTLNPNDQKHKKIMNQVLSYPCEQTGEDGSRFNPWFELTN